MTMHKTVKLKIKDTHEKEEECDIDEHIAELVQNINIFKIDKERMFKTRMACQEMPNRERTGDEIGGEVYVHFMQLKYPHDEIGSAIKDIVKKSNEKILKETKCKPIKLKIDRITTCRANPYCGSVPTIRMSVDCSAKTREEFESQRKKALHILSDNFI